MILTDVNTIHGAKMGALGMHVGVPISRQYDYEGLRKKNVCRHMMAYAAKKQLNVAVSATVLLS